jgi:hypothetical protein
MTAIKISAKGLDQTIKKLGQDLTPSIKAGFKRVAEIVRKSAVGEAPKKSGKLAGGIHKTPSGEYGYNIYESHKHGLWVREGAIGHTIYPRKKKALYWPGLPHPVAVAFHPGIRGSRRNPYPERAVSKSAPLVEAELNNTAAVIAKKLGG